jgi:hypothetical protein
MFFAGNTVFIPKERAKVSRGRSPDHALPRVRVLLQESLPDMNFADATVQNAPWSTLSWGVFIPAVFAGNVVLAIFAWFVVEWITKLI